MFGLAMFAILFLGAVLAVFLTLGVVRGDAERGCFSRSSCARSGVGPCCSSALRGARQQISRGLRARRLRGDRAV